MIAILASAYDEAARALAASWGAQGAVLVSARDLCVPGWVFHVPDDAHGRFVAGGHAYRTCDLRGVVVRRPAVAVEELRWIAAEDREYAAAEVNAFLVAWLSALPCIVLNRPTPTSLCGPAWSQTHWEIAAARAGVAWTHAPDAGSTCDALFCNGARASGSASARRRACVVSDPDGETDREAGIAQRQACERLAAAAGVALLGVRFAGDAVAAVTLQPSLASQSARNLVLAHIPGAVRT